jgi:predicted transcriptional regulator
MEKLVTFVLFFSIGILLNSCKENVHVGTKKEPLPKALEDNSGESYRIGEFLSKSGGEDLLEELYQEQVEKRADLKKLETDIETYKQHNQEANSLFASFDNKVADYYSSAYNLDKAVSDSVLRKKIKTIIDESSSHYATKKKGLESLQQLIAKKETTIDDQHTVLKIMLTLPIIEKYQKDNLPSKDQFINVIKLQDKVIAKGDSLMPKL